jgi:uncharacterized OsmC-like protein
MRLWKFAFVVGVSLAVLSAAGSTPAGRPNGLDTAALGGTVSYIQSSPQNGRVTFYAHSRWQDGMRALTSFTGYKIDGKMVHENERHFVLLGDEGPELAETDAAPGAVEELMYALGTCIIARANAEAALMGVKLTSLELKMESDLDLHGMLGEPTVRAGVSTMRVSISIGGDADEATLKKTAMAGYNYSPVSETVRNGVKFTPAVNVVK